MGLPPLWGASICLKMGVLQTPVLSYHVKVNIMGRFGRLDVCFDGMF